MQSETFELTLEQELHLLQMRQAADDLTKVQAFELLMEATRQLMVKDNIIKDLVKNGRL